MSSREHRWKERIRPHLRRLLEETPGVPATVVSRTAKAPDDLWYLEDYSASDTSPMLVHDDWETEVVQRSSFSFPEGHPEPARTRLDEYDADANKSGRNAPGANKWDNTSTKFTEKEGGYSNEQSNIMEIKPSIERDKGELPSICISIKYDGILSGNNEDEFGAPGDQIENFHLNRSEDTNRNFIEISCSNETTHDDDVSSAPLQSLGNEPLGDGFDGLTIYNEPHLPLVPDYWEQEPSIENTQEFAPALPLAAEAIVDLPDFDQDAHQLPWEPESHDDDTVRRARQKAAEIAALLEVSTGREEQQLLVWLTELFQNLTHYSTFRALRNIAENGLDGHTLRTMVELRNCWQDHPEWWVGRYGYARKTVPLLNGASALTWKLAHRICNARRDFPPELMIAQEWLDEWHVLEPDAPGYNSFPAYISECLELNSAKALNVGLYIRHDANDFNELGDASNWFREVNGAEAFIGADIWTPYTVTSLSPTREL